MPVAFGVGAGDIIAGLGLLISLLKALSKSKGSSAEYEQFAEELWSLQKAVRQVKEVLDNIDQIHLKDAIKSTVSSCERTIDRFATGLEKYHGHLSIDGTGSVWTDRFRKVQWHLTKPNEIASFRANLGMHLKSLEILLISVRVGSISLEKAALQAQAEAGREQTDALSRSQQSLPLLMKKLFSDLKVELITHCSLIQQTGTDIKMMLPILDTNFERLSEFISTVQCIATQLPAQVMLEQPIKFLDAQNHPAPFFLQFIDCWEALEAVLKIKYKEKGLRKIENREYVLLATKTNRDIDFRDPFKTCFLPGRDYAMSMIFEDSGVSEITTCTHCHHQCEGEAGRDIQCPNCSATFRRIREEVDDLDHEPQPISSGETPSLPNSSTETSRKRKRNDFEKPPASIEDFVRVRVVSQLLKQPQPRSQTPQEIQTHLQDRPTQADNAAVFILPVSEIGAEQSFTASPSEATQRRYPGRKRRQRTDSGRNESSSSSPEQSHSPERTVMDASSRNSDRSSRRASRLPKEAVDLLKSWVYDHLDYPYPSEDQYEDLAGRTGLTKTQMLNWMANARHRRLLPPELRPSRETAEDARTYRYSHEKHRPLRWRPAALTKSSPGNVQPFPHGVIDPADRPSVRPQNLKFVFFNSPDTPMQ